MENKSSLEGPKEQIDKNKVYPKFINKLEEENIPQTTLSKIISIINRHIQK